MTSLTKALAIVAVLLAAAWYFRTEVIVINSDAPVVYRLNRITGDLEFCSPSRGCATLKNIDTKFDPLNIVPDAK